MQDNPVLGSFFEEFSKFETLSMQGALRVLSKDPESADEAGYLLDFDARLKLMERMAFARGVPPDLMVDLEALLLRAKKMHEFREEVARNVAAAPGGPASAAVAAAPQRKAVRTRKANYAKLAQLANSVPPVSQVEGYVHETVALQEALRAVSERLDRHLQSDGPHP